MRKKAVVAAVLMFWAGCSDDSSTTPTTPTLIELPPLRPPAESCSDRTDAILERYNNSMVWDVEFQNDCDETVNIRVSTTLYEEPGEITLDRDREEMSLSAGRRGWLCGNGWASQACTFDRYTNMDASSEYAWRICYTDESCGWPDYPD